MNLVKRNTYNPVTSLFDNVFDDFFKTPHLKAWNTYNSPSMDLVDKDTEYLASIDVPGFDTNNLNISVENGNLVISGTWQHEDANEDGKYLSRERSYKSFTRTIHLSDNVDVDNIAAMMDNGVLHVAIPKKEPTAPERKVIEIKKIE